MPHEKSTKMATSCSQRFNIPWLDLILHSAPTLGLYKGYRLSHRDCLTEVKASLVVTHILISQRMENECHESDQTWDISRGWLPFDDFEL